MPANDQLMNQNALGQMVAVLSRAAASMSYLLPHTLWHPVVTVSTRASPLSARLAPSCATPLSLDHATPRLVRLMPALHSPSLTACTNVRPSPLLSYL